MNTKKIGLIGTLSLLLGILSDYFFYGNKLGIAFPIYITLIIGGLIVISYLLKKKIDKEILWLLIPLLFFSVMVFIHTSMLLTFINISVSLLLLLLISKTLYKEKFKNFLMKDYIKIVFLPFKYLSSLLRTLSKVLSLYKTNKDSKKITQVIKGILLAIPIVSVFILLFSSADLVFQKYVSNLITINILPETIFRIILSLAVTLVFIGAYSYIFQESKDKREDKLTENTYMIGNIESSTVLGLVNIVFFLFVMVQLTYLFGGQSNISTQGFTYAEYARKGFFELIAVAVLSLLLLLTFEKYIIRKKKKHVLGFKILSSIMIVQVVLIMVSAFMRLSLYENAYGFTTLRLYSHAFIILLAIVFCLLLFKIYRNLKERQFVLQVFVLIILFLVGMNLINPDLFIAKQNIARFEDTGKLDIYYLTTLSDDALPEMVRVFDMLKGEMKIELGSRLYLRTKYDEDFTKWQSLNISRSRGKNILDARIVELRDYEDFLEL